MLPSSTALAGYPVAASLAAAVQPVRASTGGGTWPSTVISAADDHGPRLPASVLAVSRMKRADTAGNRAAFSTVSSAHAPVATGALKVEPSRLTVTEY